MFVYKISLQREIFVYNRSSSEDLSEIHDCEVHNILSWVGKNELFLNGAVWKK